MWLVSKPPCRQTFLVLGAPGNGTAVQSAKVHWLRGMNSFGSFQWMRRVRVAVELSSVAVSIGAVSALPASGSEGTEAAGVYSWRTSPTIEEPAPWGPTGS